MLFCLQKGVSVTKLKFGTAQVRRNADAFIALTDRIKQYRNQHNVPTIFIRQTPLEISEVCLYLSLSFVFMCVVLSVILSKRTNYNNNNNNNNHNYHVHIHKHTQTLALSM